MQQIEEAKRYIAWARGPACKQQNAEPSLTTQLAALNKWANRQGGEIVRLWGIPSASSGQERRRALKELFAYARRHARELAGAIFLRYDLFARNLCEIVELEKLERDYELPLLSITQPPENTPAGRMQRRWHATVASFFAERGC